MSSEDAGIEETPAPKRKRRSLTEEPVPQEKTVIETLEKKVETLKSKRSKESIVQKKLFQSVLSENVSPVKNNLYAQKPHTHVNTLHDFLNDQAVPIPHKQACTSTPKKILPKSIRHLHKEFTDKHPDNKVSLRTVYRHKPKTIITNKHAHYRQCLCEICTNVDLKLNAIHKFCANPADGRDQLSDRSVYMKIYLWNAWRENVVIVVLAK